VLEFVYVICRNCASVYVLSLDLYVRIRMCAAVLQKTVYMAVLKEEFNCLMLFDVCINVCI